MSDCVNITWKNGLGNQLFQYSYGRILAEQLKCPLTYSSVEDAGFEPFSNLHPFPRMRGDGLSLIDYELISDPKDIVKYSGENVKVNIDYNKTQAVELENPHNYKLYLDKIKSWFPRVQEKNTDDLVVHLRLGDNGPNIYTPFEWYKKAIEDNEITFDKLYLVTDSSDSEDAKIFKSYYNAKITSSVEVSSNADWKNYKSETMFDFDFIRGFDKILFSNSTFSWWAALLSDASQVWFNKEWQPNHYNGMIRLGETDYPNWKGIIPFSLVGSENNVYNKKWRKTVHEGAPGYDSFNREE